MAGKGGGLGVPVPSYKTGPLDLEYLVSRGKGPELDVEPYQADIVGLTLLHSSSSGTRILDQGWTVSFSIVAGWMCGY